MTAADEASLTRLDVIAPMLARETCDNRWLHAAASLITGGKSNLTYLLTCDAGELILRRPPAGSVLATAHDMRREARVQRALATTAVPVPQVVVADDGSLTGVPFYVMAKVPGSIIRGTLPHGLTADGCRTLGSDLVDTLAELHTIDPAAVGLADYGRPTGFVERQLSRWGQQWEASRDQPAPALDELRVRLGRSVPAGRSSGIVHGDYRLDNCVIDLDTASVAAVLDWELSTLGDPLTDLGMLLFYWRDAARVAPSLVPSVTHLPGFPSPDDVVQRWTVQTGLAADDIAWFHAFACFKFAVIAAGIHRRVQDDAMAGQDFGDLTVQIDATAESGLDIVPA